VRAWRACACERGCVRALGRYHSLSMGIRGDWPDSWASFLLEKKSTYFYLKKINKRGDWPDSWVSFFNIKNIYTQYNRVTHQKTSKQKSLQLGAQVLNLFLNMVIQYIQNKMVYSNTPPKKTKPLTCCARPRSLAQLFWGRQASRAG
jgi:hypothetical protein